MAKFLLKKWKQRLNRSIYIDQFIYCEGKNVQAHQKKPYYGVASILLFLIFAGAVSIYAVGRSSQSQSGMVGEVGYSPVELYEEVPPIFVVGNEMAGSSLKFFPQGKQTSGLYDSDGDLIPDKQINDFASLANAANNIFNENIAACIYHPPNYRAIYDNPDVWLDDDYNSTLNLRPDVMPEYADLSGTPTTDATQYLQVKIPFAIDPATLFDTANVSNNYLSFDVVLRDESGDTVVCSVFLNGKDAFGTYYGNDPNWPVGAVQSQDVIVFIANASPGTGVPHLPTVKTAFSSTVGIPGHWRDKEMRLQISRLKRLGGTYQPVDSNHLIRRSGILVDDDDTAVKVLDIVPSEFVLNPVTGGFLEDHWPNVGGTGEKHFVPTDASFMVRFNKPVVPVTVGRSIVFNKLPFTGNMKPVPNPEASAWIPYQACSMPIHPLCPNIALRAHFLDDMGNVFPVETPIPFRVLPVHQNNLASYIIHPLIDLPGSSTDWSGDLPGEPPIPPQDTLRLRLEVMVYDYQKNTLTGQSYNYGWNPENLGVAGFHGERFYDMGQNYSKTYSVRLGPRYVNAPVSPNVIYTGMGRGGIGAIDLDGNGFATNDPGTGRQRLVTSSTYFNPFGSSQYGTGNNYAYPVGLGNETPIPGVNEGGRGWWRDLDPAKDALVRDSNGSAHLYPRNRPGMSQVHYSDLVVGDFLDTLYSDRSNPYNSSQNRSDLVFPTYPEVYNNNLISTPPTPNPPPLTLPVGMRPVEIILDELGLAEKGAFVILGAEVFPPELDSPPLTGPRQWISLEHGSLTSPPQYSDKPFPPNPPGSGPWALDRYIQSGPMAETSTFGFAAEFGSRQQIGNFLFAADRANDTVDVLNSNTMEKITSLRGLHAPHGVAISPDLRSLYVTNRAAGTVSVFDVDPRSEDFLSLLAEIPVGDQPMGICCQPDYEDVLVCNYGSSTISIIDPKTNTVRKTLTRLLDKPIDVVAAPRQNLFGWGTSVYHAYVLNHGGDNVLVYESGPDGLGGIGWDDILGAVPLVGQNGQTYEKIEKPRGICYDPLYLNNIASIFNLVGGCFVAHSSPKGATVTRINFVDQQGPIYIDPAGSPGFGKRKFLITAQWNVQDGHLSGNLAAADVALPDFNRYEWLYGNLTQTPYVTNLGALGNNPLHTLPINNKHPIRVLAGSAVPTWLPEQLFISYPDTNVLDVLEIATGRVTTVTGLPQPVKKLTSYFKH